MGDRRLRLGAAIVCAVLLSGCGITPGSKAGPQIVPITLHLATPEADGAPYTQDVRAFAAQVEQRSGGAVRIAVDWQRIKWTPESENDLARMVEDGRLDLAWLPTRALANVGTDPLSVLQAPFLIDTPGLASAVATSPIADEILGTLKAEHMVGLGLVPEGIRRPVGYTDPLISLSDYEDRAIRVPKSDVAYELFAVLGALPSISETYDRGAAGESLTAAESGPEWRDSIPAPSVITADVGFYPKFDVIVSSDRLWSGLTESQRSALAGAAKKMSEDSSARRSSDSSEFAACCANGGAVVLASPQTRAELSAQPNQSCAAWPRTPSCKIPR